MQISTREQDYIIDTLELRGELYLLNEVFTDHDIVKVSDRFVLGTENRVSGPDSEMFTECANRATMNDYRRTNGASSLTGYECSLVVTSARHRVASSPQDMAHTTHKHDTQT